MTARTLVLAAALVALCGCTQAVRPAPPTVDCRQAASPPLDPLPAADEWVEWVPPTAERPNGLARLSARAAEWVASTLVAVKRERALAAVQERCLDGYEKAGAIRR
jgi:hypothetical protein